MVYAYTTATSPGTATSTVNYTYGDSTWGDLLTKYGNNTVTSDAIGNTLSDGTRIYTWKHGRQLATTVMDGKTWTYTYNADGMRTKRVSGNTSYTYYYNGDMLRYLDYDSNTTDSSQAAKLYFVLDAAGNPIEVSYRPEGSTTTKFYYYVQNLQGDVVALVDSANGNTVVTYTYDAWGNVLSTNGSLATTLGVLNPFRYRGYVYDTETKLYYLQSRYYNPEMGRFINADVLVSTGQGILGNNMFAYCNNNPVMGFDPYGYRPHNRPEYFSYGGGGCYSPNIEFLMAFYGVDSPSEIPEMPEGAMIFVENITSVSNKIGVTVIEGRTIVFDKYKYCEYTFVGVGWSISLSMPLDRTISQGYVYGLQDVDDYCGLFFGGSFNMLADIYGGAIASSDVYAEITGGMSYAPSIGGSITWYMTGQSDWIYGRANMVVATNPYHSSSVNQTIYM